MNKDCTDIYCKKFHLKNMCYFFLFENCKFGNKCKDNHTFNRKSICFTERQLTKEVIDDTTLMKLIRLSEDKYSIKFCINKSKCEYNCDSLHCCKYHFTGQKCNFSMSDCVHGHSLYDNNNSKNSEHNLNVLSKRDLNDVNELDLRNFICDAYKCFKSKCKSVSNPGKSSFQNSETNSRVKQPVYCSKSADLSKNNQNITKSTLVKDTQACVKCKSTELSRSHPNLKSAPKSNCDCKYCLVCYFDISGTEKCIFHK